MWVVWQVEWKIHYTILLNSISCITEVTNTIPQSKHSFCDWNVSIKTSLFNIEKTKQTNCRQKCTSRILRSSVWTYVFSCRLLLPIAEKKIETSTVLICPLVIDWKKLVRSIKSWSLYTKKFNGQFSKWNWNQSWTGCIKVSWCYYENTVSLNVVH